MDKMAFYNKNVAIGEVKMGCVVKRADEDMFGHIIGFSRNPYAELIIKVKWDSDVTSDIHPANVLFLSSVIS